MLFKIYQTKQVIGLWNDINLNCAHDVTFFFNGLSNKSLSSFIFSIIYVLFWQMFLHIHKCTRNTSKWRKMSPFPHSLSPNPALFLVCCVLWQDIFLFSLLISQLRALGWELSGTAAALLAQETGLAPLLCCVACAEYQTGALCMFIHFLG